MTELPITLAPIISTAELRALGYSSQTTQKLIRTRALIPLARGWYSPQQPPTPEIRHRLITLAAMRTLGAGCVASHYSALLQRDLPIYDADLTTVHLSRVARGRPVTRRGLVVHRPIPAEAVVGPQIHLGLAIAQNGIVCGPMACLIAADAALHRGLLTREDLSQALDWVRGHPNTGQLDAFLRRADARSESPGETRLRYAFHLMGHRVIPQSLIRDGSFCARVDFQLVDAKVIVEFDGLVKYGRGEEADGQPSGRDALVAEKVREDRLRELGYEVVRVTWAELANLPALARRMRAAINRAQARRGTGQRSQSA